MKIRLMLGVAGLMAAALAGCSTVEAVGEDLSEAGSRTKQALTGEPAAESTARGGADSKNRD